jgi:putative hydrolase of the HAD superfamily
VIKAVFLDVGGVFHLPTEERMREALRGAGFELPANTLARAHYAGMSGHDRGAAETDYQGLMEPYVEEMVRALEVPAAQAVSARTALLAALTRPGAWAGHLRESVEELPALAATGVRLAIVSNSDGTVASRLRSESICQVGEGPGVPVDAIVDSGAAGISKPDPRIWDPALAACGVAAADAIHVGDSLLTDVGGARAAGIRPIHFDPYRLCGREDHEHAASLAEVTRLVLESRS